ncbi:MAG: DUF948 domain-containing protein [Actinobacteria bacterium]|nr:DUF948 domain-containing protein [Actinomycetota bacterium]MBU1942852.1 DUF948 domain-containing protein [Actinomycetota bacterium]MBU2687584.1 DUF948 domain-containing protein [Actinomycetota bacterium]
MALKILQIVGAAAVVIIVALMIPVLLRLRRTVDEVGQIVSESRPQTVTLLSKANATLDSMNRELENIEEVTGETQVLVDKVTEASVAVERAIKSPLTRIGFIGVGAAATGFMVKRRLRKDFLPGQ